MYIAVVDDEPSCCAKIDSFIEKWKQDMGYQKVKVDFYDTAEKLLFRYETVSYDLYLLDIRLPNMNGFELAKRIRNTHDNAIIVFITNDDSYMENGYELMIYRYIKKPVSYEKLRQCFDYAAIESESTGKYIVVKNRDVHTKVLHKNIIYMSAGIHSITLHTIDKKEYTISIRGSIDDFLKEASDPLLIRVHRGYMVNLRYVEQFTKNNIVLSMNMQTIPIGRYYQHDAVEKLKNYFFFEI